MINLSLKGIAQYMNAAPATQRKILEEHKYREDSEGAVRRKYYAEAIRAISTYHTARKSASWLEEQGRILDVSARQCTVHKAIRLRKNASALTQYRTLYADRIYEMRPSKKFVYGFAEVQINFKPDIHCVYQAVERYIKLDLSEGLSESEVKIVRQIMFSAVSKEAAISESSVVLSEIRRGVEHEGKKLLRTTQRNIEAACQTISDIWEKI